MRIRVKRSWIWASLLACVLIILSPQIILRASELGGYLSEVLIARLANSDILIDRTGVGNSSIDIGYAPPVTTLAPTGVYIDGAGTHATLQGSVNSMQGFPTVYGWFEWGYNTNYGNIAGNQTINVVGTYTTTIDHYNNDIVHYRFVSQADGTNYGSDITFQIQSLAASMPPWIPVIFVLIVIVTILMLLATSLPPVFIVVAALILGIIGVIGAAILAGLLGAMV